MKLVKFDMQTHKFDLKCIHLYKNYLKTWLQTFVFNKYENKRNIETTLKINIDIY